MLVRVDSVRINPALLGEDDERRAYVWVLDDVGAVGRGNDKVASGRSGMVDKAMGTFPSPWERDYGTGRQEPCLVRAAQG